MGIRRADRREGVSALKAALIAPTEQKARLVEAFISCAEARIHVSAGPRARALWHPGLSS